jgi:hypothetical protein
MPRRPSPSTVSRAIIGAPLSLRSARGRPRLRYAWINVETSVSAVSARYHCAWQQSLEWSSSTPHSTGYAHRPLASSTRTELWWKS